MIKDKDHILQKISSDDPFLIKEAINEIKTDGDISITPMLLDMLAQQKSHYAISEIISLLADIKDNAFREILINHLKRSVSNSTKVLLLRICWESSLNYSEYLDTLLDILLKDEFMVAFEACTAIEETLHYLDPEKRQDLAIRLESIPVTGEKKFLIDNLLINTSRLQNEN